MTLLRWSSAEIETVDCGGIGGSGRCQYSGTVAGGGEVEAVALPFPSLRVRGDHPRGSGTWGLHLDGDPGKWPRPRSETVGVVAVGMYRARKCRQTNREPVKEGNDNVWGPERSEFEA